MSDENGEFSALINTGVQLLNADAPVSARRTIIVLGVARSGTTMVAGALHHLGVDMSGGGRPNAVHEDVALSTAMESRDYAALQTLVAERDARGDVWGWKRPSSLAYMGKVEKYFHNPEYVVVFRDIFAIANRNRISVRSDLLRNMSESLEQYGQLLEFLRSCRQRVLLVSYEKSMLDKRKFLDALIEFVGPDASERRARAEAYIRKNSKTYLVSARNWRCEGEISSIEPDRIGGWAFATGSEEPVVVELSINKRLYGTMVADLPRPLLSERGQHPTGNCGFNFRLPKMKTLKPKDLISVRISGETRELRGSPKRYTVKATRDQ